MAFLLWDPKDPDDVLDYVVDWTAVLSATEAIITSEWEITPVSATDPLTKDSDEIVSPDAQKTRIWLSGGNPGVTYLVVNTVTTDETRTFERTVKLKVKDL